MSTLYEIAEQYGVERLGDECGTDKTIHRYLAHYEARFATRRDDPVTLLELGVLKGASLRTWRDYFSRGKIYGIDLVPEHQYDEERIQCFLGPQENARFLEGVMDTTGPLDIVIDDGSHRGIHHVSSYRALWPHVKPGGWYCIEDAFSIFNECWIQPGDYTIIDMLRDKWSDILLGKSAIAQVHVISDGCNDGLIMFRKRAELAHPSMQPSEGLIP